MQLRPGGQEGKGPAPEGTGQGRITATGDNWMTAFDAAMAGLVCAHGSALDEAAGRVAEARDAEKHLADQEEVGHGSVLRLSGRDGFRDGRQRCLAVDVLERDQQPLLTRELDDCLRSWRWHGLPLLVVEDVSLRAADPLAKVGLRESKALADRFDGAHAQILAPLVSTVNSAACCEITSAANNQGGMTESRNAKVTDENRAESARLLKLWEAYKTDHGTSQAEFGEAFGIGSQSAVGFFLNGKSALSLKAAKGFAEGLKCQISDFSPRLAKIASDAAAVAGSGISVWPFPDIDMSKLLQLDTRKQAQLEGAFLDAAHRLGIDIRSAGARPGGDATDHRKDMLDKQRAKRIGPAHVGAPAKKTAESH